jgi:hypothetical protein
VAFAVTFPSLTALLTDARLDASGDLIRARMADARSMAMEQGRAIRFGFLPGTGQFQIAADDNDALWSNVQESTPVEDDDHIRGVLLEEVLFSTDIGTLSNSAGGAPTSSGGWQTGGVFLANGEARPLTNPDGTTSDDLTFYFGKAGFAPMGIRLRGMTGMVRVFDPALEGDQP